MRNKKDKKVQAFIRPFINNFSGFVSLGLLIFCGLAATGNKAFAQNLLVNGNLNSPSNTLPPTAWTVWTAAPQGYANHEIVTSANLTDNYDNTGNYDGTYQMSCGATANGGGGGFYQIVGGTPNVQYTLIGDAGAQGWWLPTGQIRLIFLDISGTNILGTNYVDTTDSLHSQYNGTNDIYDYGVPWQEWTNIAVSPPGTALVKVECAGYGGGTCWFDNLILTSAGLPPPVITNLYPDGSVLQQNTNQLSFNTIANTPLTITNIDVVLNGVDITASLTITGSSSSKSVSYSNLKSNTVYTVAIIVTDSSGANSFKNFTFDTYSTNLFSWEAEDYDYNSGQYINNPILSSTPTAGSYFGLVGTAGVDYGDYSGDGLGDGPKLYRTSDTMATDICGDTPRQKFKNAGVSDYNVGYFNGAGFPTSIGGYNVGLTYYMPQEWVNYTRNFPTGTYNLYARIANGNGGTPTVPVSKVTGGWGTANQTTVPLGVFNFLAQGWSSYNYVPMTDQFGNKIAVPLSGTNTINVSAGSGANLNFFFILPADTDTPTITGVYPDGSTLVQGTNKLTFTVSSANHSIPQGNVVLTLNGVTNNNLTFSGSFSSWNVSTPLALNVTNYTAVITVTDNAGNSHSTTIYFDTFDPASYDIEAEDFDFSGGQYIDNPVITSNAAPNSYFDKVGTYGTDEYPGDDNSGYPPATADYHFRESDYIATSLCTDTPTRALVAAQQTNALAFNYNVAWWSSNGWVNYTHNYPSGTYNVYGRLAGNPGSTYMIELDKVGGSATNYLGTFVGTGRGFNAFDWIPLINTNNNLQATVALGGLAKLRTTTWVGNVNPNSYLLVPAPVPLQYSYSGGVLTLSWTNVALHLVAQTNSLNGSWASYPGGGTSPVIITPNKSLGDVFFRLSD